MRNREGQETDNRGNLPSRNRGIRISTNTGVEKERKRGNRETGESRHQGFAEFRSRGSPRIPVSQSEGSFPELPYASVLLHLNTRRGGVARRGGATQTHKKRQLHSVKGRGAPGEFHSDLWGIQTSGEFRPLE